MENINACIEFANENKMCCYLATLDNDQPRVRAMQFWFADQTGFYFQTGAIKDVHKQVKINPKVEVCFYTPGQTIGKMLRVAGKIEFVDDKKMKEKVMAERPFLKEMGLTSESPGLIIFRIAHGEAHFWTMETNLKPKQIIRF
jgi:pyridoxamine 5'-phosphate oxidase